MRIVKKSKNRNPFILEDIENISLLDNREVIIYFITSTFEIKFQGILKIQYKPNKNEIYSLTVKENKQKEAYIYFTKNDIDIARYEHITSKLQVPVIYLRCRKI